MGRCSKVSLGMIGLLFTTVVLLTLPACKSADENTDADVTVASDEEEFSIEAFGTVRATRARTLAIEFPATIETVHASDGQKVEKGTVLISLDTHSYISRQEALSRKIDMARLKLRQIKRNYEKSDETTISEYRKLENSIGSAQQEIDQLKREYDSLRRKVTTGEGPELKKLLVDLEQSKKELSAAEDELNTKNELFKEGSVLEKELEQERNAVEALRSRVTNLGFSIESMEESQRQELSRLQLSITQKSINIENMKLQLEQLAGPETTDIQIQESQIEAYEKELEELLSLSQFEYIDGNLLVSDVKNGIIQEISGTEGEVVATGMTLVKILDLDSLVVEAGVPEEFIKEIEIDSEAKIKPLADSDREYVGTVTHISGMAVSRNGETVVDVILQIIDHDGFLIPNFNVDIEFSPEEKLDDEPKDEAQPSAG